VKVCFKCKTAKSLSEFYKHPRMGDGHLGKCKECTKKDTHENRWAKIERYRQYDRQRASQPHRVALRKEITGRWAKSNPAKRRAQALLRKAVLAGKVKPQLCLICGEKAEAHHPDYSQPLDVVWLCTPHHRQAHAEMKKAA